jgi:hypothetical protein
MGEPVTGTWNRAYTEYAGASVWGTGINPIHAQYGSAPLRTYGREGQIPDVTPPHAAESIPGFVEESGNWGFDKEDIGGLDVYALSTQEGNWQGIPFIQDGWPSWNETTPQTRVDLDPRSVYPVGSPGIAADSVRSLRYGPRDMDNKTSNEIPTETVSEGWVNKPASGMNIGEVPDDHVTIAADSQVFVNTSMVQRHKTHNNERAVERGQDEERTDIPSRIAPMKLKIYSGQERHYDMTPRDMLDIPRPFWFRKAGIGRDLEMLPNEMVVISPLQRTPPPDPAMGQQEIDIPADSYGYTGEDQGWY